MSFISIISSWSKFMYECLYKNQYIFGHYYSRQVISFWTLWNFLTILGIDPSIYHLILFIRPFFYSNDAYFDEKHKGNGFIFSYHTIFFLFLFIKINVNIPLMKQIIERNFPWKWNSLFFSQAFYFSIGEKDKLG